MNRSVLTSFTILCLLFAVFLAGLKASVKATPSTIYVPTDYLTIQEAVNNAYEGDSVFVYNGTYYEHVVLNRTVSLVGEDVSTTILDGNNTGHVVNVVGDNVSITGFTVRNSGSIHVQLDAGICLNGTIGCTISENRLVGNGFAGISLLNSNHNTISHNNLSSAGWGGVHLMNSSRNIISANTIADKYGGINGHVSSNYNNFTENVISNCTYGEFYHASSYNNICRNNISAIAVEGIWLQDQVNYNVVTENNLINNTVAIRLEGPNYNNTLSRNVITGAEYGIRIQNNARYTSITDNIIVKNRVGNDSWSAGIRLDSGWDSQIHSNTITGNNYGVLLYSYSPRVSIYNNTITDNEFGLRVASGGSNYVNVSDNIVMNNRGYGIGLTGFGGASNNASITRNLITNNSDGIALGQYSNYNTILQNRISMNDYGFYIEFSTQNSIYSNNVVNNAQQAYVASGSVNTWDNRYPSGGNYWSDYSGVDLYSGPHQNETGYDWIGDAHYVIDANNMDLYPLTHPFDAQTEDLAIAYRDLLTDYNSLLNNHNALLNNVNQLTEDYNALNASYHQHLQDYSRLQANHTSLQTNCNNLQASFGTLNSSYTSLIADYDALSASQNTLNVTFSDYKQTAQNELVNIKNMLYAFIAITVILAVALAYVAIKKPKTKSEA